MRFLFKCLHFFLLDVKEMVYFALWLLFLWRVFLKKKKSLKKLCSKTCMFIIVDLMGPVANMGVNIFNYVLLCAGIQHILSILSKNN